MRLGISNKKGNRTFKVREIGGFEREAITPRCHIVPTGNKGRGFGVWEGEDEWPERLSEIEGKIEVDVLSSSGEGGRYLSFLYTLELLFFDPGR